MARESVSDEQPGALLGPAQIRCLADRLGVRPTKTLGQNFVHDAGTVRRIVRDAGVAPGDVVLEVGPGLGSLTLALLEAGAYVSAVEIDPVLAGELPATVATYMGSAADRFAVLRADALDVRWGDLAIPAELASVRGELALPPGLALDAGSGALAPTHLVANLPYNVAVPVLLTLLEEFPTLRSVTVMVQLEVAERLAAEPGSRTYGVPSVKAAWYGKVRRGAKISRNVFWPVPNVDSALVHLDLYGASGVDFDRGGDSGDCGDTSLAGGESPSDGWGKHSEPLEPPFPAQLRKLTFEIVDAAFAQRRKTLRAALAPWTGSARRAEMILAAASVDPTLRGERLGIADFLTIARTADRMGGYS